MSNFCLPERITKLTIAVVLLIGGVGMLLLGFTVLPVIGFAAAVPMLVLAGYFFYARLNEQCEISAGDDEDLKQQKV